MFDKLKYNNLLISGSKEIQKAKIQVVRRIIQKIQKLKKTIERKPDDESLKIKLRKCLAIVEIAKKIKKFDAITNILLLEKCPDKIVTNSRSTPEQVAIAMLASNVKMKTFLEKTREELKLNDIDTPDWRKTLVQLSKQKIKTERRKKKKLALKAAGGEVPKKDAKTKKTMKKKKSKSNDRNQVAVKPEIASANEKGTKDDVDLKHNENKIHETKLQSASPKTVEKNVDTFPKKSKASKSIEKFNQSTFIDSVERESKKIKPKPKSENVFLDNHNEDAVDSSSVYKEFKNKAKVNAEIQQEEVKITKVVDSFFMTSSGENYVAIALVIDTNNEVTESNSSLNFRDLKKEPSFKSYKMENKFKNSQSERQKSNKTENKFNTSKTESQKVHPSWEAKQKQRAHVDFQGKRKVFDGTDDRKSSSNDAAANLHPSWLAKQKLKPTITAFQGKKIKFDDA